MYPAKPIRSVTCKINILKYNVYLIKPIQSVICKTYILKYKVYLIEPIQSVTCKTNIMKYKVYLIKPLILKYKVVTCKGSLPILSAYTIQFFVHTMYTCSRYYE